ncbi:MAG TPA: hypothetical protein PL020_08195, partial [Candidatus Cloacimonadota bacterium]|nr:hypothetical protein [Candidatus Cloacimonadota bacterium]
NRVTMGLMCFPSGYYVMLWGGNTKRQDVVSTVKRQDGVSTVKRQDGVSTSVLQAWVLHIG